MGSALCSLYIVSLVCSIAWGLLWHHLRHPCEGYWTQFFSKCWFLASNIAYYMPFFLLNWMFTRICREHTVSHCTSDHTTHQECYMLQYETLNSEASRRSQEIWACIIATPIEFDFGPSPPSPPPFSCKFLFVQISLNFHLQSDQGVILKKYFLPSNWRGKVSWKKK